MTLVKSAPPVLPLDTDDERWRAVTARDRSADGAFVYSVRSTGVYCRPSCPARRPRRENVRFHATGADAERHGFRSCKRCRPEASSAHPEHARAVSTACALIQESSREPRLETLARAAGMSPSHFHRVFKSLTGVTPKAYASARRSERVRSALSRRGTVTAAIGGAGFGSSSRFYARATELLGMTPTQYRRGGAGAAILFAVGTCALGAILVAATRRGVCAISLGDDPSALVRELEERFPRAELIGGDAAFEALLARVVAFVEQPARGLDLPLDVRGTAFQHRVWMLLREIPCGATRTYSDIARDAGAPAAARAVARACAANLLAVAIPCHRVVRADASGSDYRWGAQRKTDLLAREAAAPAAQLRAGARRSLRVRSSKSE
jgi:AraC family transcriptional regulator of adaptative response/methylated-DNA-[protein]-cysteine methyltransferase